MKERIGPRGTVTARASVFLALPIISVFSAFFIPFVYPPFTIPDHVCPRYLFSALLSVPFPPPFAISLNPPRVYTALVCRLAVEILADLSQRDCNAACEQFFLPSCNACAKCVNVLKNVKILPRGILLKE